MSRKLYLILLLLVCVLAFILRFYKLGEIPYGFYQDESAIGYNAYSILQTGRDEHGEFLPLYFKSFGDYKLPVYIYMTAFSVKLFGLTEFAVRLPSALFSFLTVPLFYFFVLALSKRQNLAVAAAALLAINPWHLHYARATFEVSIAMSFFVLGGFLLHKAYSEERKGAFFLGAFCFIISLYSYNLTRLLAPLLFIAALWFFKKEGKPVQRGELVVTVLAGCVLLVPFVFTFFQGGGAQSARGTFIFSSATVQAQLLEFRSYLTMLPALFTKGFFNMFALTLWQFLQHAASYFSVAFLFISGASHGNHGIGNVGQFYLFELPLVLIGIYKIIREKLMWGFFLLLWAALVILVASLTREAPHATRSFFLIVPLLTFSAIGMLAVLSWIKVIRNDTYRPAMFLVVILLVVYALSYYFVSYYVYFPVAYAKAWRSTDKPLSLYLAQVADSYDKIVFDKEAGFIYTSLLFYEKYPSREFHKTSVYEPDDSEGFSIVRSFGKYEFREIDWSKEPSGAEKILFITNNDRKPADLPPLKAFFYPKRPVVLPVKQEIIAYPVEEVSYVVFESNKKQ